MMHGFPKAFFLTLVAVLLLAVLGYGPALAQFDDFPHPIGTLHDGLTLARADQSDAPAAVAAFRHLERKFGTPLYIYDQESIETQARILKEAFGARFAKLRLYYAVKANTNLSIMNLLRAQGFGMEVISGGEILSAMKIGVPGSDILFTSSSKSPWEIDLAVRSGVHLNVDSLEELGQIELAAARSRVIAPVSFRINPGVDPHTIHQINTGISESKFGLHLEGGHAFAGYRRAQRFKHVRIVGLHCHIGSQITETEGYELAMGKILAFALELREKLGIEFEFIDIGGGIGIPYHDGQTVMTPDQLADILKPIWKAWTRRLGYEPTLVLEPGRYLVAPSGFLLARVNTVKTTPIKTFVNVNAGFNTLVRPAMYQAFHRVRVVGRQGDPVKLDIAGDVCETGDILAADRMLPMPRAGDLVVILDAGAYGFSMASEYNARPLPAEVLVKGDEATVIRRRGRVQDLFRNQYIPKFNR